MLPMESLIYGSSSIVLLHLRIAACMILYCVILELSKNKIRVASMGLNVLPVVSFALDIM